MATIGQQLLQPESGWKRYDDSDLRILYTGTWTNQVEGNSYNGNFKYTSTNLSSCKFQFFGTQFRVIARVATARSSNIKILIDGIEENFSEYGTTALSQVLVYEKLGLILSHHTVEIIHITTGETAIDAIDIDENGRLLHPILTEKTNVKELQIGDVISCEYIATANTLGSFQNLGKTTKPVIPPSSSNTPNGTFYWIMTGYDYLGRKKLVADRNIQHSISWDVLNTAGLMSGVKKVFSNDNIALGKTVLGEFHANYPAINAVDGNNSTQALLNYTNLNQGTTTSRQRSITIDLTESIRIQEFVIISVLGITSFDIEVSDDNINFTKIYSGTINTNTTKRFVLPEYTAARYFSVSNIQSSYSGTASLGFSEIELYEGEYYELTIPTGGTSATDKDNDWDKIIVESTLNNTITAGDNNIWNWNINTASWTSTTGTVAAQRIRRGYANAVAGHYDNTTSISSTASSFNGFRPMLLVPDNIVIKSLIKDSLGRYIGLDGSVLYNAGTTPTDEIFQTYGVVDLNLINWTELYSNFMPPFEIASYIQEIYTPSLTQIVNEKEYNVVGRVYEKEIEVNDLERIKNIQVG